MKLALFVGLALFAAAFVVKSLSLDVLRWLVVVVAVYTALLMLRAIPIPEPRSAS